MVARWVLRMRRWKLVTGGARSASIEAGWRTGFLKGCTLGSEGGWGVPPTNRSNMCPSDIYTSGSGRALLSCPEDTNRCALTPG